MPSRRMQIGFFTALLGIVLILAYFTFRSYFPALFLSFVLYITFEPIFNWAKRILRGNEWLSAFLTVAAIVIVILLPFIFFGFFLFQDARDLYIQVASNSSGNIVHDWAQILQTHVHRLVPIVTVDVEAYINDWLASIVGNLSGFFSSVVHIIINLVIILVSTFFLYRDSDLIKRNLFAFSPLPDSEDKRIFDRIKLAVNSVIRGSIAVALAQGMVGGIGFALFGLPSPFLWGGVMAVAALVPSLGTSLVFIPSVIYLFITGHTLPAIGLALWGAIAVGLIDNLLGPYIMKRGMEIHPFLILLSALGGVAFFGPIGFIAGPVILALLLVLISMYPHIVGGGPIE